jgi:hypothetical protein
MTVQRKVLAHVLVAAVASTMWLGVTPAIAAPATLVSTLEGGAAEVPDPGDPDGSGAAEVKVYVKKEKLCFTLVVLDITLPTAAAHIHDGGAGTAGPIAVTLEAPEEVAGSGIGLATGCVKQLDRALLRDIKENPADYYINVHTSDFPGGAVRGQLEVA